MSFIKLSEKLIKVPKSILNISSVNMSYVPSIILLTLCPGAYPDLSDWETFAVPSPQHTHTHTTP